LGGFVAWFGEQKFEPETLEGVAKTVGETLGRHSKEIFINQRSKHSKLLRKAVFYGSIGKLKSTEKTEWILLNHNHASRG
jgi:hypothetical protein